MEFNLDFLKKKGDALKDFGNTDEEDKDERSSEKSVLAAIEKQKEKNKDKEVIDSDEESADIENIIRESKDKKEEEKKEKGLDEKLKDIEKVIEVFSGGKQTNLSSKSGSPFAKDDFKLNKGIDFQSQVAKNYIAPYLQQPTSQGDRIAILLESLKKQNLI